MPYVTLLINGTGWSTGFPRVLPTKDFANAIAKAQSLNLPGAASRGRCVGDISCDIEVSEIILMLPSLTLCLHLGRLGIPRPRDDALRTNVQVFCVQYERSGHNDVG